MLRYQHLIACTILMVGIVAQGHAPTPSTGQAASQASPSLQAQVQALSKRTLASLIPFPGGTFDMGDWGNDEGLQYDSEPDSKPLHKVTLSGFSMMAYKVSYADFDIFTDSVGEQRIDQDESKRNTESPTSLLA